MIRPADDGSRVQVTVSGIPLGRAALNCWVWPAVNADDEGVTATTVGEPGANDDLAFSALLWVPLTAPDAGEQSGSHDVRDRSRRLHLLLDA